MKPQTFIITVILTVIPVFLFAQYSSNTTKGQGILFVDSAIFLNELITNKTIRTHYQYLKEKGDYETYKYSFKISSTGKVIPMIYGPSEIVNQFVRKTFDKYRWKVLFNSKDKVVKYCGLNIDFIPIENRINILITGSDGSLSRNAQIVTFVNEVLKM